MFVVICVLKSDLLWMPLVAAPPHYDASFIKGSVRINRKSDPIHLLQQHRTPLFHTKVLDTYKWDW